MLHKAMQLSKFVALLGVGLLVYLNFFAPARKVHRLASEGAFYLRKYVSIQTARGIAGLNAGQMVHRVSANLKAGMVRVTDGVLVLDLPAEDLTDDLDVAESLAAENNQAFREWSDGADSAKAEADRAQGEINASYTQSVASYGTQMSRAGTVGRLANPFNVGTREIIYSGGAPNVIVEPVIIHSSSAKAPSASVPRQIPSEVDRINMHGLSSEAKALENTPVR